MSKQKKFTVRKAPEVKVNIPTGVQQPQPQTEPTGADARYCIEENVTTGWEVIETDLTKENARSKYKHYFDVLGLSPQSIRIRRIR